MSMKRRRLINFFKTANLSNGFHRTLIYISFLFMSIISVYLFSVIRELSVRVSAVVSTDQANADLIYSTIKKLLFTTSLGFFLYFVFILFFVLFIEYKVAGPTQAILKFISELKQKNFDYVRPLRTGDELGSIMDALVDLQQDLKEKK